MDSSIVEIEISVLRYVPSILAWGAALVLAIIMLRRGGGKAEKLLLSGCILMFFVQLGGPLLQVLRESLIEEHGLRASAIGFLSLPSAIFGLAGLVLLVIAFWLRFKRKKSEAA